MLHMGHALDDTIQDTYIRYSRMRGYSTRWIVGTDHAGIATQTKVDKKLKEQGIDRRAIGREKFLEACQEWKEEAQRRGLKNLRNAPQAMPAFLLPKNIELWTSTTSSSR